MRISSVRTAVGIVVLLCAAASASAQPMENVSYFPDSIAEKGDRNHIIRLSGGSSWVLATPTLAIVSTDVMVVTRDVLVEGKRVRAAWLYVDGEEIPACTDVTINEAGLLFATEHQIDVSYRFES